MDNAPQGEPVVTMTRDEMRQLLKRIYDAGSTRTSLQKMEVDRALSELTFSPPAQASEPVPMVSDDVDRLERQFGNKLQRAIDEVEEAKAATARKETTK